jgi:hypothetical protein
MSFPSRLPVSAAILFWYCPAQQPVAVCEPAAAEPRRLPVTMPGPSWPSALRLRTRPAP